MVRWSACAMTFDSNWQTSSEAQISKYLLSNLSENDQFTLKPKKSLDYLLFGKVGPLGVKKAESIK